MRARTRCRTRLSKTSVTIPPNKAVAVRKKRGYRPLQDDCQRHSYRDNEVEKNFEKKNKLAFLFEFVHCRRVFRQQM